MRGKSSKFRETQVVASYHIFFRGWEEEVSGEKTGKRSRAICEERDVIDLYHEY